MFWAEIWKISEFLSENFQLLVVKFSVYLNRHVFIMILEKCPGGWVVRAPDFRSGGPKFESCWRQNSSVDCTVFHCTEPFSITLFSSHYDLKNVERDVKSNHLLDLLKKKWWNAHILFNLTLVLLNPGMPCFCKQCRSRSVGFWRSQLIWICTVCYLVCEFVSTTWIK